ncbi:hypothetical protein L915_18228 [Phytophthora nicotianae]|uniref:FAD-binding FR-type domain-containing protein n=1 Tax=Phytophthora nicotianae TaxID=4792 RepID=W2I2V8_PHYNI|nr:hypothetical protein L915_18228 [Phytophthora nicotianae]ETL28559.1 hypothetical protein L916_18132 [Phytophthora nicotianae]
MTGPHSTSSSNSPTIRAVDGFFSTIPQAEASSELLQLFRQFKLATSSWSEFREKLEADGTRNLKVVFFIRHGEGLHNEAIKLYGSERWYKELVTSDVYRDAELTPFGIQDAKNKGPPSIKAEMERGMPPIERVVVSPISRAIQTAQNFFVENQIPDKPFVCIESCREHLGVDTCNNRRSVSELKAKFPAVDFSALKDEEDTLWTTDYRESAEEIQTRAKEFLTELFRTIPERHVAVVTHFGFIEAVCAAMLGMKIEADDMLRLSIWSSEGVPDGGRPDARLVSNVSGSLVDFAPSDDILLSGLETKMVVNYASNEPQPGDSIFPRSTTTTPASTIKSEFAMLETNTPVECTHTLHQEETKELQRLPSALAMPRIYGPSVRQPPIDSQSKRTSFVAMLGGSGVDRHVRKPLGNSRRGHTRRAGGTTNRSSFLPNESALNMSFHPSMSGASMWSRPSRQMNKAELYELKDRLWKDSLSSAPSNAFGAVDCGDPHAPEQLSFFTHAFNTSRITGEGSAALGYDERSRSSMAFIPLPRESVAMMIDAVRVSALDDNEKCRFLFEMFDVEHHGVLTKEGVRAFIEATFAANGVDFVGAFDYDAVVDKVFGHCRQPYKMTFNEFKAIFADVVVEADDDKSKEALGLMSSVVETQRQREIVYNNEQGGRWYRVKKYCRKYKPEIFWLTLYFLLMIGVFIAKASRFPVDPAVGNCPRIAKGFAEICLVNTMFVLLPMCRNFVTGLRTLPVVVNHLPIDNHIEFHKVCGVVMLIASVGHTAAWLAIVIYVRTVPLAVWEASRYHHLSFVRDENLFDFALRIPIWTGMVMLICAGIAAPLCLAKYRRGNFNMFWVTHMLFIPFLVLMAFHGFARWLAEPQAQYWILPPVVIFLIEKRYRMTQVFGGQTKIIHVQLSKESVAIFMKKPRSFGKRQRFLPGMYMFINVPAISKFEWHPFTISSAPEDKFLSLHIQKAGDWTGALYKNLEMLQREHKASSIEDQGSPMTSPYPVVYLDGPVGAPAQDYSRYREVVLIGAGIGVTPFASILRSIMHQWESFRCPHCRHVRFPPSFQLRKIYFYWVTREQESLTWFTNTMNQLSEMDTENRLEIHNFFSSVKSEAVIAPLQALQKFIHNNEGQDIISGLNTKQQTHFGRPDWNTELSRVARNHRLLEPSVNTSDEREEIGVFFCGPKPLGNIIHEQCTVLNQAKARQAPDVQFEFHSENF